MPKAARSWPPAPSGRASSPATDKPRAPSDAGAEAVTQSRAQAEWPGSFGPPSLPEGVGRRPPGRGWHRGIAGPMLASSALETGMGYRITIDHTNCINCGVCMDVCPVEALDMTRPEAPGVEASPTVGRPLPWMMEHPVQVGECIGCAICVDECPVSVMTLDAPPGLTALAARQGPLDRPSEPEGWVPLSAVTREVFKPDHR